MHAAPPLMLSVDRNGQWRAGVLLLATGACASMAAWWWAQPDPVPAWATATALLGFLVALACVGGLWRLPPVTLRWDRQRWQCTRDGAAEWAGELAVAVDLGGWMLLRFVPDPESAGAPSRPRSLWVAVQRRGLEAHWHALRCALYAARPAPRPGGGAGNV